MSELLSWGEQGCGPGLKLRDRLGAQYAVRVSDGGPIGPCMGSVELCSCMVKSGSRASHEQLVLPRAGWALPVLTAAASARCGRALWDKLPLLVRSMLRRTPLAASASASTVCRWLCSNTPLPSHPCLPEQRDVRGHHGHRRCQPAVQQGQLLHHCDPVSSTMPWHARRPTSVCVHYGGCRKHVQVAGKCRFELLRTRPSERMDASRAEASTSRWQHLAASLDCTRFPVPPAPCRPPTIVSAQASATDPTKGSVCLSPPAAGGPWAKFRCTPCTGGQCLAAQNCTIPASRRRGLLGDPVCNRGETV